MKDGEARKSRIVQWEEQKATQEIGQLTSSKTRLEIMSEKQIWESEADPWCQIVLFK